MTSSNPVLRKSKFIVENHDLDRTMTMQGTAIKTFFLLSLASLSAGWLWYRFPLLHLMRDWQDISRYMIVGGIGAFCFSMVTTFKPSWAFITAPLYALLEGLLLGSISLLLDTQYPGIVRQALPLTSATLAAMLLVYVLGIIRVTHRLTMMIVSATSAIFFIYCISYILRFFGISFPFIHETGILGIGFSFFVVCIAAFNLLLDFDFIEKAQSYGAPKYMEWYSAFALMVTLVWLYVEILHLLAKLRERKRG